jgi:tetratricopeptide (TPR) repeat protein
MTKSYPKIFLSYAAGDSNIADRLYNDLKNIGILLVRDVLEVAYKQSFKVFMDSITTCDYSIVLVSDNYLKSENCMYEALKMMEDDQFQDKILPILIQKEDQAFYETDTQIVDTKLSRMEGRYAYFQFWSEQYKQTNNKLKSIENQISLSESQNHIEMLNLICQKIEPFLEVIQDLKASSFSELVEANYQPLLNQLGIKDNILLSNLFGIQKIKSFSDQQLAFDDFLGKYGNEHSEFYFIKGYEWQNKGEIDVAKTYYEKTLKLNPSYVAALNNLGLIYKSKENNHKQAEAHFLKSIDANPNNINGYINLGNLYSDTNSPLNNPEKANHYYSYCLTYLQKYVESHPEDEEAKKRLLNIFFQFPSQDITKMKQFWYKIIGTNEELKTKVTEFYDQFQVQGIEQEKERLIDLIRKNPMNIENWVI